MITSITSEVHLSEQLLLCVLSCFLIKNISSYSERPGYDPGEGPEASGNISYKITNITNITIVDLNNNIRN